MRRLLLTTALLASIGTAHAMSDEMKRDSAVKLFAAAAFTGAHCPAYSVNYHMLLEAMRLLGLDPDELKTNQSLASQAQLMVNGFARNRASNCNQAWEMFGAGGSTLAGIIERK